MSAKMRELHYDKHHKAYVGIPQQAGRRHAAGESVARDIIRVMAGGFDKLRHKLAEAAA